MNDHLQEGRERERDGEKLIWELEVEVRSWVDAWANFDSKNQKRDISNTTADSYNLLQYSESYLFIHDKPFLSLAQCHEE